MSRPSEQLRVAAIYNPQNQSKTQLIEGFVVRLNTFKSLYKAIRDAKMEVPEQHYLILARRGMGKTTLLLRLAYEVENDPALNEWLIPLVFNEEEYGIRRLFNFWERAMDLLENKHPEFRFDTSERKRLSQQHKEDDAYERALFEWFSSELTRLRKKVILFIDNFGDIAEKLSDEEAHRLRKILQTSADIRIMAASSVVLESFYKYEHPFYEFFKVIELKGLDAKETRELLLSLSQHYGKEAVARILEQHPGRVEALRRITGGVIRTMVLLFEIFADDSDGSAFKDLEIILDRATPLYKHRMDDLSAQQQAIVEAIALNWDALSVREITESTRLESKIVSAQLQVLEKNGVIQKIPTKTKNHLYIISERFFNIWFLMRLGRRGDEKRVLWLVRFFEEWCDPASMRSRAELHRLALQKGRFDPEAAYAYTQVFMQTKKLSASDRHEVLRDTRAYLREKSPDMLRDLAPSDLEQAFEALKLWFGGDKAAGLEKLKPLCKRLFSKERLEEIEKGIEEKGEEQFWEGYMGEVAYEVGDMFYYLSLPDFEKAEICWRGASNAGNVEAMFSLGLLFDLIRKDIDQAKEWYLKSATQGHAVSMYNLGHLFQNDEKNINQAIKWYQKAAEAGDSDAMFALGYLYKYDENNIDKAIEWYLKAAEAGNSDSMNNLGIIYKYDKKDIDKALIWYQKAAEVGVVVAMSNLGIVYEYNKKDIDKAKVWYLKAAEGGDYSGKNGIAWLLFQQHQQKDKALHWATQLLANPKNNDWHRHTAACVLAWDNRLSESKDLALQFLKNKNLLEQEPDDITTYFLLLLAKNEARWLFEVFTGPKGEAVQLKDRFKPVYYAILKILDHPDALRMGDELQQTVEEILVRVKEMEKSYQ